MDARTDQVPKIGVHERLKRGRCLLFTHTIHVSHKDFIPTDNSKVCSDHLVKGTNNLCTVNVGP